MAACRSRIFAVRPGSAAPTYYQWKSKYGGMEASDLKRVKELEAENAKLKRMYAELALEQCGDEGVDRKKTVGPAQKREAVRYPGGDAGLPASPVLRLCRPVALGLVCAATGLDGARRRADCRAGEAGGGAAQPRVLEVLPATARRAHPHWNDKRIYRVYSAMKLNLRRAAQPTPAQARARAAVRA